MKCQLMVASQNKIQAACTSRSKQVKKQRAKK